VATTRHHNNAIRSYPDQPHSGTTTSKTHRGANNAAHARYPKNEFPMRIARIETIPMTDDELHRAGKALGVLLNAFLHEHPDLST
jgi:hypothetical protein